MVNEQDYNLQGEVERAERIIDDLEPEMAQEDQLRDAYFNLHRTYRRIKEGTEEDDDYLALGWDLAQVQEIMINGEDEQKLSSTYDKLTELYHQVEDDLLDENLSRPHEIREHKQTYFDASEVSDVDVEELRSELEKIE